MNLRFICFLGLLFLCLQASAQIINADRNTEGDSLHPNRPKGIFGLSASADKQKQNLVDISSSADFSFFLPARHVAILMMRNDLTTNGKDIIQNSGIFHLRFRDNDFKKLYPEAFFQFQWNGVLGMAGRGLAGCNARWKVFHEKDHDLFMGLGLMAEVESWNFIGVPDERKPADPTGIIRVERIRINQYIKWARQLSPKTDVVLFNFLQMPTFALLKPRLASHAAIQYNPGPMLGFSFIIDSMFDFMPVVPIDKFYYSARAGINLSF